MVGHGHHLEQRQIGKFLEYVGRFGVRQLQPDMQEVFGPQLALFLPLQFRQAASQPFQEPVFLFGRHTDADRLRIKDRGNPCRGYLRVVRDHGGVEGPLYAGAWRRMLLQCVGMQIDQAGDQEVPFAIHYIPGRSESLIDAQNLPAGGYQRAANDLA
jgi:hypothetical protein